MEMKAKIRWEKNPGGVGERRAEPDISAKNSNLGGETWWEEGERHRQTPDFSSPVRRTGRARRPWRAVLEHGSSMTRSWPGGDRDGVPSRPPVQRHASWPAWGDETGHPHLHPPPLLWQGLYLLWLGLKGPVPMTGRCGPGRFIQRRRDWQAALPETPHITHFTRGEKNLTVWPTFLEQTTRQTTPAAFPKQPQPQPWGRETLVWEELQLQAAVANPGQSHAAPCKHHAENRE